MKSLSHKEKAALIKLLSDDDPAAMRLLEDSFRNKGGDGVSLLQEITAEAPATARRNAETILESIERELAAGRFRRFCKHGTDLERGTFLLAATRYPHVDAGQYSRQLDEMAEAIRPNARAGIPSAAIAAINQHLFRELGFTGNSQNYYDPDNSFINKVLDRRTGIPITLSAVYLFVAWRLALPLVGVGMPGHFIVRWLDQSGDDAGGLFVDPFNGGQILKEEDCVAFLERNQQSFSPEMLAPVSARQVLARMCNNLVSIYRAEDEPQSARLYEDFATALSASRNEKPLDNL